MARRQVIEKPVYRFIVVDESIHTWAVKDRETGKIVQGEFNNPVDARIRAEYFNINPQVIDAELDTVKDEDA